MSKTEGSPAADSVKLNVDELFQKHVNNVVPVDLDREMRHSFIDYAMSVIADRALPDVRDGLKPVHRRILYSMYTQGFTPDKPYRKCATTVGDVLGRFHPHGDAAVYDALVRLAQDFSMRMPLVDGHGNFGSRDGDAAAAYRYTEARLTKLSVEMMNDINKQTVDFRPNFDEHEMEPVVLPTHYPNLLVNGSTGIAVGMATSIPPHNLGETIAAAVHLMQNPDARIEDLMQHIKGPDFPTGGTILGQRGIRECYQTGRGRIVVRANAEIEAMGVNRQRIVVHDLPYMVNKAALLEKISEQVKAKRIEGISHIRDESDRNEAVRIVIELKRDANANLTLNQLYKYTQMQDSFSANLLALVPEKDVYVPKTLNLKEILSCYVAHQKDVHRRKTQFELERALARKHIVEGLRIAIDFIDDVIRIIRSSKTEQIAKERLCEHYSFSERQAQHIVDMRLGRLTGLERDKLEAEFNELCERIAEYEEVLRNEGLLIEKIVAELEALAESYGDERRTKIDPFGVDGIADESLIKREDVVLTLTRYGYIKRIPLETYQMQHRGGRGISGMSTKEEDMVESLVTSSSHDFLLFFTNTGRVFRKKAYEIPEGSRQSRGMAIVNLLQLDAEEKIIALIPLKNFEAEQDLVLATAAGMIKKTPISAYRNIHNAGIIAVHLRDGDQLVAARLAARDAEFLLLTREGKGIRFASEEVRETGRNTFGVRGMRLREGDSVVAFILVDAQRSIFIASERGFGKRTDFSAFRNQSRGGLGLIAYVCSERTGKVAAAATVGEDEDLVLMNNAGIIIRIAADEVAQIGRAARGVSVMRCDGDTRVVDLSVVKRRILSGEELEAARTLPEEVSSDAERQETEDAAGGRSSSAHVPQHASPEAAEGVHLLKNEKNQAVIEAFFSRTAQSRDEEEEFEEDWTEEKDAETRRRRKAAHELNEEEVEAESFDADEDEL